MDELLCKNFMILKEQLVTLSALSEIPKTNEQLIHILNEDISLEQLNSETFSSICYYLLGIIDTEERDKLMKWPLTNIQSRTKFRKGLSAMIKNFQDKFPWANTKKLPESYFVNPHSSKKKVIDFLMRLSDLAIHIALSSSGILQMHSGKGLSTREIETITDIVCKAKQHEEKLINENIFPKKMFEEACCSIINKCIALKELNDQDEHKLSDLMKTAVANKLISSDDLNVEDLRVIKDEKLSKLGQINEELAYFENSNKEVLLKLKALQNPVSLSSKDFGCNRSPPKLQEETSRVCKDLYDLFESINLKKTSKDEEEELLRELVAAKEALTLEKESLKSAIDIMTTIVQ